MDGAIAMAMQNGAKYFINWDEFDLEIFGIDVIGSGPRYSLVSRYYAHSFHALSGEFKSNSSHWMFRSSIILRWTWW
jgi:hypothetical protein